jgi:spore maturation protein CgeB
MSATSLSPILEKNLRAIASRDAALAERLQWPASSNHVILSPDGPPLYRYHGSLLPLGVEGDALEGVLAGFPENAPTGFLFGAGLGEALRHILRRRPQASLVAWDRDPWLLRECLARWDYSHSLASGRLRLGLGVDLARDLDTLARLPRCQHPTLGQVYRDELALLENPGDSSSPWAAVGLGGLFVHDLCDALREEGFRVFPLELVRWSREEIEASLRRLDPALVATINYTPGLAELCEAQGHDLCVWEIDPTSSRGPALSGPVKHTRVFTYRASHVAKFREAGIEQVERLPLAANPRKRRPVVLDAGDEAHYAAPVCFVGASMQEQARQFRRKFLHLYASWHPAGESAVEQVEATIDELLATQAQDLAVNRIPELASQHFGPFLAAARTSSTREDPGLWLAEIAAAQKRASYVTGLAPQGVRVWGDPGWEQLEPAGVRYMGSAEHDEELTRIYSGACVHVDINRLYQPDVVTLRVFDVLACGGFLIAEHSQELESLFQIGDELETYHTQTELEQKVAHYIAHPDEAAAIAARGRAAVLARHTVRQRVRHMLGRD